MTCNKCGSNMLPEANFCLACGTAKPAPQPVQTPPAQHQPPVQSQPMHQVPPVQSQQQFQQTPPPPPQGQWGNNNQSNQFGTMGFAGQQQNAQQQHQGQQQPHYYNTQTNQFANQAPHNLQKKPKRKVNPTGMILGIISLVFWLVAIIYAWLPVGSIVGIVFSVITLALAIPAKAVGKSGLRNNVIMAKPGNILGTIGIVLGIVSLVASVIMTIVWFTILLY
ncbi:MAG: hypothetical protein FWC11_05185 [Firmicutes bacterium]|nr:hypothetical protein [Bacillota bacterium]